MRVLIVDDSVVARTVLARVLAERGFEVAGQAASADSALARLATLDVEVILLDLEMPGTDGLAALPELLAHGRGARVLIVSSACASGAAATVAALRLGAADTLLKPGTAALTGRFADELAERMRRIASPPAPGLSGPASPSPPVAAGSGLVECIGIGASTGGVAALDTFLKALPASVTAPILVTQHLPAPFMPHFVPQLAEMAARPVRLAAPGLQPQPGEILLAPGDASLTLARIGGSVHVRLERRRSASGCLPSVDPMFISLGQTFGAGAVGVVLSGMGRDGAAGAAVLARHGGCLLAQDAASSVVWGMPGAIALAGLAQLIAAPDALARAVASRSGGAESWT